LSFIKINNFIEYKVLIEEFNFCENIFNEFVTQNSGSNL